jgi:hypothetical protein
MLREYTELSPESEATLTESLGDETSAAPAPAAGDGPAEPPAER